MAGLPCRPDGHRNIRILENCLLKSQVTLLVWNRSWIWIHVFSYSPLVLTSVIHSEWFCWIIYLWIKQMWSYFLLKTTEVVTFSKHLSYFLVAFVPGVRYHFRVFGSVANKASLLEKKAGYSKELRKLNTFYLCTYLPNGSHEKRGIFQLPCDFSAFFSVAIRSILHILYVWTNVTLKMF